MHINITVGSFSLQCYVGVRLSKNDWRPCHTAIENEWEKVSIWDFMKDPPVYNHFSFSGGAVGHRLVLFQLLHVNRR